MSGRRRRSGRPENQHPSTPAGEASSQPAANVARTCGGETRIVILTVSEQEREVLQPVARGHTYKSIGEDLFISERTVENHVRTILGKLHLSRKQELIRYALEHGIE